MHNIHKREESKRVEAEGVAAQVAGKSLAIEVKASDTGKLFGSVTAGMVADALMAQLGVDVDRRRLDLHGHIRTLGEHTIDVRIYEDVTAQLVLNVVAEGGATAATEAVAPVVEAASEEAVEPAPIAEEAETPEDVDDEGEDVVAEDVADPDLTSADVANEDVEDEDVTDEDEA
jgi:large subunit ribosomal protein L9